MKTTEPAEIPTHFKGIKYGSPVTSTRTLRPLSSPPPTNMHGVRCQHAVLGTWLALWLFLCSGCTPAFLDLRSTPTAAVTAAEARLKARGIRLDGAARGPLRLRTPIVCFVDADGYGFGWDRAFGPVGRGPLSFEVIGANPEQEKTREKCPYQFRVSILAEGRPKGSRLRVETEWWRVRQLACHPHGNPLLGKLHCRYTYTGTQAPRDVRSFIYGILRGL